MADPVMLRKVMPLMLPRVHRFPGAENDENGILACPKN